MPAMSESPAWPGAEPGYGPPPAYGVLRPLPPLAEWWERLVAQLVDSALSSGPELVGLCVMLGTLEAHSFEGDSAVPDIWWPSTLGIVAFFLGCLISTGVSIWNRWVLQGRTGQSVGKRLLGIRLVGEATMAPVGTARAFLRELCHILDAYSLVGYLWPLWDARRRTFADMVVHTVVVQVQGRTL